MPQLDRVNKAYDARLRKASKQITDSDLTDSDNAQTFDLDYDGAAFPAGAYVFGVRIAVAEKFSGGSASAVAVDVGDGTDGDAYVDGADVLSNPVDGEAAAITAGIAPHKPCGGKTLKVTVNSTDDTLDNLTQGDMTVEVLFAVPE